MATVGAVIFFVAAWQLNPLALMLAPVAAVYVVVYSFAKYYTWLCSLMLGLALSIAPSGAWIGVTGQLIWQPVLLTFAVAMWAGGFETIYGSLDYDFDRANRINSIASRFGVRNAIRTTRVPCTPWPPPRCWLWASGWASTSSTSWAGLSPLYC